MQPIQINVSVNLGVTSELAALLSSALEDRKQVEPEAPKPAPPEKTTKTAAERPAEEAAPAAAVEEKPAEAEAPKPAAEPEPVQKEYTEVDVREAMDSARKRIEGENYKERTDSEDYQKWHRKLTTMFKEISARYGSDKPSTLPDSESREKFIRSCDTLAVVDGKLTEDLPF